MRRNPEILLISSVLRTGDLPLAVRHGASARLFHVHADEWRWIEKQYDLSRKTPDKTSFKHQFPQFPVVKTDDVLTALEMVKQAHARYETQAIVEEAITLIENNAAVDAVKLIAGKTSDLLYEVEHNADAVDVLTSWQDTYDDVLARVERARTNGSSGVSTGLRSLDYVTGGLQPGWFVTVAARLGIGKTWSLIRFAHGAVSSGYNVLYFSLEQHRHQIAMRFQGLAATTLGHQINPSQLAQGIGVDPDDYKLALEDIQQSLTGKFYVNDAARGRVGVKTVAAAIEAKQPDIVLIDYLTLLQTSGSDKWQGVAQLSGDLKVMAEEYGVPIVVASQLNRMGTGRDPGAEHISQSDAVGQDSDLIVTLTDYSEHLRKMKVVKNRHGQSGLSWFMHFDPARGIFDEITGNEAERIEDADKDEE